MSTIAADPSLLGVYLNDHLAGASGGLELFRRAAGSSAGTPAGELLKALTVEVAEDREALLSILDRLAFPVRHDKVVGGWLAEKATRAKPNGRLLSRSALDPVIELEALHLGVLGKGSAWRLLRALDDPRVPSAELDRLIDRAERQAAQIEALRIAAARQGLSR